MKSRRFLIFLSTVIICLGVIAVPVMAESQSGKCGNNLTWILDDDGVLTISGTGEMYNYEFSGVNTNPWHDHYKCQVRKVIISEGVTSIGDWAFCTDGFITVNGEPVGNLNNAEISIPKSVKKIGKHAFAQTFIKSLVIESSDTVIKTDAFINCKKLSHIDIAAKNIGQGAFYGCETLNSVVLRPGVQTIGESAFSNCDSLTSIKIPEGVSEIKDNAFASDFALVTMYMPKSVTRIGYVFNTKNSFAAPFSAETPETIKELKETLDDVYSRMKTLQLYYSGTVADFNKIEIVQTSGDNNETRVQTIAEAGLNASFQGCNETYKQFPGVTYYRPADVVVHCSDGIYTPPTPKAAGNTIPQKGDTFNNAQGTYVFNGKEGEITLKKANANTAKAVIPSSEKYNGKSYKVTEIAPAAFQNSKVKEVSIGANVKTIGKNAFKGCTRLTKVTGGKGVTQIGNSAFMGCKKLKSASIGSKVIIIGAKAFYGCTSITKIIIPAKVSKIGASAFQGDKKLKIIIIKTTKLSSKKVGKNVFKKISSKAAIKVPKKMLKAYKKWLTKKGLPKKAKIK